MKRYYCIALFATLTLLFACKNEQPNSNTTAKLEPPANPHFELLNAKATGIDFANRIKESFELNIITNAYLYNGGGVAIIDINNDELPDVYFTATQGSNKLYLNKGDFKFEDITDKAGVAATSGIKTGVSVADVNGDGFQDLYVCRTGIKIGPERGNLLFINTGNLQFTEQAAAFGIDDQSASNHANFFDFDLDGDLDLYVLNHPITWGEVNRIRVKQLSTSKTEVIRLTDPTNEWESDKLFRNDGNGRFTNVSKDMGIHNRAWGLSVSTADFNDDGYPDIYVGNDYIEPDILYINQKGKGFKDETWRYFRHISSNTMGVDIADVNNDGLIDLVSLDMIADNNQRRKELMTTMIQDRYQSLVKYGYGHQLMRNALQINNGTKQEGVPKFDELGIVAGVWATDWSWSPLLADFDNDGLKDLFITNGYRRDVTNLDYLNYTVDSVMKAGGLNNVNFKTIDDYLKKIPTTPLSNFMFKNTDGTQFKNVAYDWGLGDANYSNGSAYSDLDRDGDLDLIVNQIDGEALVYRNKSSSLQASNWLQVKLVGSSKNPQAYGAKLRIKHAEGIQYLEMTPTRGFYSASEPLLHFGLGKITVIEKLEIKWPDGKVQALENLPANQRLTLKIGDAKTGNWEKMPLLEPFFQTANGAGIDFKHSEDDFNDFARERLIPHAFSNLGPSLAVGDVNGDGLQDFFVGGASGQAGAVFIQQKNSSFKKDTSAAFEADKSYEDMGCLFFDADGDKDADLYVVSGGSSFEAGAALYQDRLYINDGKGGFAKAQAGALPTITASGSCVVGNDFDKDGDMDLVVGGLVTPGRYPTAPQTLVLQNEKGKFTEVGAQVAPDLAKIGMVNDLVWADLDGDKSEELIVAGEWLPISVFKNKNGKLENSTAAFGLEASNGWWNCVQVADMDKDGDLDLIAGNLGLNTRLKASSENPIQLYAADFDKNGSFDPVMTYWENSLEFPIPQRDAIVKQMPVLKKDFVYHKAYGHTTIQDLLGASALKTAQKFVAKLFATSFFENNGGKMTAKPLPMPAQHSTCNQIATGDFDADGQLDLMLVGNSYHVEVESARYDASNGTILLGDGKGGFKWSQNRHNGFWAAKEARDLVSLDLANGKKLYVVANNNDVLQAYLGK